jgi:glycosyltransferase involved in cell wall biosynthesis
MTAPITCVVTCFNNSKTLGATVRSVLNQTLPVSEIILSDDGSSDGTRDLVEALARSHDRITPLLRERNVGVSANRDLAIRSATQPFITYLDGDDRFARSKVEAEWTALNKRHVAVAYSYIARVWPQNIWRTHVTDPSETVGIKNLAFHKLAINAGAAPRDLLMSKSLFEAVGGFTHGVPLLEDWEFIMRLARKDVEWVQSGSLGTIYIQHGKGLSSADEDKYLEWSAKALIAAGADASLAYSGNFRGKTAILRGRLAQRFKRLRETLQAVKYHNEIRRLL